MAGVELRNGSAGAQGEPGNDAGVRRPGQFDQEGDGVGSLLVSGAKERHDPTLGLGSPIGAVPAPDLAVDDGRPDALLAAPVGGIDAGGGEEGEQRSALMAKVVDELAVGVVGMGLLEQQVEALADVDDCGGSVPFVEVAGVEGFEQEIVDLAWRASGPGRLVLDHLVAAPDEMGNAALVRSLRVAVVNDPAVTDDGPGVVGRDESDGLVEAPASGYVVDGGVLGGRHPQPDTLATDPPSGFIHRHRRGAGDVLLDRVVGRDQIGARRCRSRTDCAGGDVDTQAAQHGRALPETQAERVVKPRRPGQGPRADMGGGCTEGVGGLFGMAALDAASTAPAAAHAHPEAGDDGTRLGKLGLELVGPPLEVDALAAVRAALGQRCINGAVGLRWRGPMAMPTVELAPPAPRSGGLVVRFAFGERCRLALARTAGLLQQPLQLRDTRIP